MKRHFIKKPVMASTSFWSTDVNNVEEARAEIQKALDAGTTFEDIDDYLNELYNLEIIDDEQFSELLNWAAPLTSNGDVYAAEATGSKRARFEVGNTYTASGLYGDRSTYKVVSRTANTVTFAVSHLSEDDYSDVDDGTEQYDIVMQDMYDSNYENVIGKQEAVVLWEYGGHQGYLSAKHPNTSEGYEYEDDFDDYDRDYAPSSTRGDYSPSNPWDAPGMSIRDFI